MNGMNDMIIMMTTKTTMTITAKESYNAGDVILRCKPLVHSLHSDVKAKHCDNCLKRADQLLTCDRCGKMFYCSEDCRINDWTNGHNGECRVMANKSFDIKMDSFTRLLIRLYHCVESNTQFVNNYVETYNGSKIRLKDIEVDFQRFSKDAKRVTEFMAITGRLKYLKESYDINDLHRWYACLRMKLLYPIQYLSENVFELNRCLNRPPIALTVTLGISDFKHSCVANAAIVTNNLNIEVRAMNKIMIGEEITINRIEIDKRRSYRKQELGERFWTECHCYRCLYHLDKDLDYKKYNELLIDHKKQWNSANNYKTAERLNQKFEMDSSFLLQMQLIFGEYHPFITTSMVNSYLIYAKYSHLSTKPLLILWYNRIIEHIEITHGLGHPLYEMFTKVFKITEFDN
ncbi:N-lysine methyltransferase SMYD2-B-like [Oppia nitens]|uniref:N-lysine methyltransferase SMYD2-B-like n=1 Tax=Oppia nitens TaxID=1686743 RepID=UPI0023D9DD13|nr:N-lysine methyltransferase SMYD2-B-like [Oppia nitens]